MKYRQALECWNCQQEYSFPLPKVEVSSFIAVCPYCEFEGVVDLTEFEKSKDLFRGEGESSDFNGYLLPRLIKIKKNDQ